MSWQRARSIQSFGLLSNNWSTCNKGSASWLAFRCGCSRALANWKMSGDSERQSSGSCRQGCGSCVNYGVSRIRSCDNSRGFWGNWIWGVVSSSKAIGSLSGSGSGSSGPRGHGLFYRFILCNWRSNLTRFKVVGIRRRVHSRIICVGCPGLLFSGAGKIG